MAARFCISCGAPRRAGVDRFCSVCGAPFEPANRPQLVSPSGAAIASASNRFQARLKRPLTLHLDRENLIYGAVIAAALLLLSTATFLSARPAVGKPEAAFVAADVDVAPTRSETGPAIDSPAAVVARSNLSAEDAIAAALPWVVRVLVDDGSGSGVILTPDGLVVTNAHVVRGSKNLNIGLRDGTRPGASIEALNEDADLALVRFSTTNSPSAQLADPRSLVLGESLIAIGYALGIEGEPTITRGVFSGLRTFDDGFDYVQTDAAINPGNSGGPLISVRAEVIGLNTGALRGGRFEGLGFAVSSGTVKTFLASGEDWKAAAPDLDESWGDWDQVVHFIDGFLERHPGYMPAKEKLYSALVSSGQLAIAQGDRRAAVTQLERARELLPGRGEARALLTSLTPTPTPRPTLTPIPRTATPRLQPTATPARSIPTLDRTRPSASGTVTAGGPVAFFTHPGGGRAVTIVLTTQLPPGPVGYGISFDVLRVSDGAIVAHGPALSKTRIQTQLTVSGSGGLYVISVDNTAAAKEGPVTYTVSVVF